MHQVKPMLLNQITVLTQQHLCFRSGVTGIHQATVLYCRNFEQLHRDPRK